MKNLTMAWIESKKAYNTVPKSWIIDCLKMYNISAKVINFIENTMENWRVELTAEGKSLAEVKIQRGIFQGDALSSLLFVKAMVLLIQILRKCAGRYKLHKSQEEINHLMNMDDIKLFAKNEKELEILKHAVKIFSDDIELEFGIEKCVMLIMKSGKRHWTEGIDLPRKNQNAWRKGNLQIFEIIGSGHH